MHIYIHIYIYIYIYIYIHVVGFKTRLKEKKKDQKTHRQNKRQYGLLPSTRAVMDSQDLRNVLQTHRRKVKTGLSAQVNTQKHRRNPGRDS